MHNLINGINLTNKLNRTSVQIRYSKFNLSLCSYLFKNGYLTSYTHNHLNKIISLNFSVGISYIKQISKPSRKITFTYNELVNYYKHNKHMSILSTSKGILNNKEAMVHKLGGVMLFIIIC